MISPPAAVKLCNLSKHFGEVAAVDHVSLTIADGEFFSLLGPSGCGKTTLLRLIAGFELPTSGEINIHGRTMEHTPPYQRPVNTVFQNYALFPHLNVARNVGFGLKMQGVETSALQQRVAAALRLVRLEGYDQRRPKELSGGQQQRVALARALVNEPEVLLLDEPMGALDLKLRKELQLELRSLQERVGITFVYVTHDQEEALTMSDRIAVMNAGRILQIGSPMEIYERPNCRFVAGFIGETNFLQGWVVDIGPQGHIVVRLEDGAFIKGISDVNLVAGTAVTVSIRPEKAYLAAEPAPANAFHVQVERVIYVGRDTRVVVMLGGQPFTVWEQNSLLEQAARPRYAPGDTAYLVWPVEGALVLSS